MNIKKLILTNIICITLYNILHSIFGILLPILVIWFFMAYLANKVHCKFNRNSLFFDEISIILGYALGPVLFLIVGIEQWDLIKSKWNCISIRSPFTWNKKEDE
jgi:hypothetical protein